MASTFLNLSGNPQPDDVLIVEERVSAGIYIFSAIAIGLIGFFGFVLNLLVILTVVKDAKALWTPVNVILVNMVVSIGASCTTSYATRLIVCVKIDSFSTLSRSRIPRGIRNSDKSLQNFKLGVSSHLSLYNACRTRIKTHMAFLTILKIRDGRYLRARVSRKIKFVPKQSK